MHKQLIAVASLTLAMLAGCSNKAFDQCMVDANKYEADRVKCLAIADAAEKEACTSKNEVHKLTPQDCQDSYK